MILFSCKVVSQPLTTPEEAKLFLAIMRDESRRKEEFDHKAPNHHSTTDGMDAWYMMQRNREKELKLRRHEAEQLLRGYRGTYFSGEDSPVWSPRSQRKCRSSFGLGSSEILVDPATERRRQTTMPRLEGHFDDEMEPSDGKINPNSLDPTHVQLFEKSEHEKDGAMGYDYDGKAVFRPSQRETQDQKPLDHESREPLPTSDISRIIDYAPSQGAMSQVSGRKSLFSTESRDREDYSRASFQTEHPEIPQTTWRDFISSGK